MTTVGALTSATKETVIPMLAVSIFPAASHVFPSSTVYSPHVCLLV
jgi:hypothetical protein